MYNRMQQMICVIFALAYCIGSTDLMGRSVDDNYRYLNCTKGGSYGIPLVGCTSLTISSDLTSVTIEDNSDLADRVPPEDDRFFYINSTYLPIAIPKDYSHKMKRWTFQGFTYLRVRSIESPIVDGLVDVIIVIRGNDRHAGRSEQTAVNDLGIVEDIVLSLWYSNARGVQAIGYPGSKSSSGAAFYCADKRCLFAQ